MYGSCSCCYSTCRGIYVPSSSYLTHMPYVYLQIHLKIHAFEDSNNMQENLPKQWKYFPAWGDILVQTFLCIVHFSFVKMVNSSLIGGGDRRYTDLWWILANECEKYRIQTAVKLWRQRKITPFMPLNLSIFLRGLHPAIFFYESPIQSSFMLK